MEPQADAHQSAGDEQAPTEKLIEEHDRERGAHEGSGAEVGAGARGAEVAQAEHEEHQAHAVAAEAGGHRQAPAKGPPGKD